MAWTTRFTEDFTGTNGDDLTTLDASWTKRNSDAIQSTGTQAKTVGSGGISTFSLYENTTTLANKQAAEIDLHTTSNFNGVGVRFTWDGTGGADDMDGYFVFVNGATAYIYRRTSTANGGPSWTLIDSQSVSWTLGDTLRIEADGTTLTTYKNGVATGMPSGTDAQNSSGTSALRCIEQENPFCDNFLIADDVGGGGGATIPVLYHHYRTMAA